MGELFVSYIMKVHVRSIATSAENSLFRVFPLIYLHSCFVRICWLMSPSLYLLQLQWHYSSLIVETAWWKQ